MIIKTAMKLSLVCCALLLTACKPWVSDDIGSICKDSPELCADLHKIGDCRFKRTTVIRARYYDKIDPTEINKRVLLTELDEYESCLELTLFMEYTRNKQRKKLRLENYLKAQELIQINLKESKGTQDPTLAYYLWTRHQDMQARKVFLAFATKEGVSDPKILFKLAAIYSKDDTQKSLNLFYKALRFTTSLKQTSPATFIMIMTLFYQNKSFEEAYVWALIAKKEDKNDEYPINLELILQKGTSHGDRLIVDEVQLRQRAQQYYRQLSEGDFQTEAPILP